MSVLKITNGRYTCGKNTIFFDMNGQPIELSFKDPDIRGLTQFKRFKELEEKNEPVECGSFNFEFYIDVKTVIEKVHNLYKRAFKENRITVEYSLSTRPLVVKTTDAVLLQVFINLFDNSLYWLKTVNGERKILITLDGDRQRMIFSDSGPGIKPDDIDYIFEAFYSGKGEESEDIRLTTEKELVFSAKQHFSLDQMREICQDTEKLEVFNRNFSRHRNSIFFRKGTILERDDKVIIGCVAGEQAIQFKMDLEILSFNAWKEKRIGRVLPPYITKIQQKCAVNMVREGVAPLPKELFISFED